MHNVYVKIFLGDYMIRFLRKNKGPIITFFIALALTLLLLKEVGILDGTILISDLNAEYQPLLMQVNRILTNKMGLYNFNTGMGDSFIGTFYYYVSSPLNILTIFIKDINLLVIILVTLKLSLSALFSYFFFKYQFKEEKIPYICIFSLLYAFSSFSLSYYLHIMWLDVYMLFPLLLLGIDKIIKEKKHLLYIISLLLIIFCNYYFAYMICIFSFIYFNYKLLLNKISLKKLIKENIHFIIVSILTCIIASIVLIPIASEIKNYSRQNSQLFGGEKLKFTFDLYSVIKYYILGNLSKIKLLNEYDYYIYTSIIIFPLIFFYFTNKEITIREKILSGIILLILILSMSCNYLNYAWHGFVPPSFFNGRYTFMFILFILLLCIKSIYHINSIQLYKYIVVALLILTIILLPNKVKLDAFDIIKIILFMMYLILLYLIPKNDILKYILLTLIVIETNLSSNNYLSRYNYNSNTGNDTYKNCINYIKEQDDSLFYRIEDNNSDTDNYSILYNYKSIDYFMSTIKKDLINYFINLNVGNHDYTKNTISYDGSYYLISSLLNIKYYIETKYNDIDYYEQIYDYDGYSVYKNNNYLNLGYMVNNNITKTKLDSNGLENIKNIYKDMSNIDILEKVELNKEDNEYSFKNKNNNNFYILINLKNWYSYSDLSVKINNKSLDNSNGAFYYYIKNDYKKNDKITINLNASQNTIDDIEGVYVYYIDNDKYNNAIKSLKENQLEIKKIKNNSIEGEIVVKENNILFTSIPYSNDLDIYVDGKKIQKIKLLDTFLGAKIEEGTHKIVIKYTPKILYISFIPSILSEIILYIYIKIYKKKLVQN